MKEEDKSSQDFDEGEKVEAYSHYRTVSEQVHDDVHEAIDAFSFLNSKWTQNMGVTPQNKSSAKRAMLRIAKRLSYEIKMSKRGDEELKEIHERWQGGEDEPGYLKKLEDASLNNEQPWLSQMMDDLVEAAWRLGYTQSGRMQTVHKTDEQETEAEVRKMFD